MATTTTYSSSSQYYNTSFDTQGWLSYWVPRSFPVSASDQIITISAVYDQRPDLLAHDLYGDARLWWVFAQRNPNQLAADPLGNFVSGLQIYIPSKAQLNSGLGI
jgi:hypothetical protein